MPFGHPFGQNNWMPFFWLMWLFMTIFWVVVIYLLVRWFAALDILKAGGGPKGAAGDDPLDVAKRRYARGEISKEEYEEICQGLKRH